MIVVRLEGRLGNQLFQYAFAYATAKRLGVSFYIDKSIEVFLVPKYFEIKNDIFFPLDKGVFGIKGFKNIFNLHLRKLWYHILAFILGLKNVSFSSEIDYDQQENKITNAAFYMGFFQSERYFSTFKDDVKKLFTLKSLHVESFFKIWHALPAHLEMITIHLRRTDYVGSDFILPLSYYHENIKRLNGENRFFIFISDDPKFAEDEFSYLSNKYVSHHSEIIDFQMLIHADICVLSNSSFSWWGAYLNQKKAQIIAPKYWSGFNKKKEDPSEIALKNWILYEC